MPRRNDPILPRPGGDGGGPAEKTPADDDLRARRNACRRERRRERFVFDEEPPEPDEVYRRPGESPGYFRFRRQEAERRHREESKAWSERFDAALFAWKAARRRWSKKAPAPPAPPSGPVDTGGILHLSDLLRLDPDKLLVLYSRTSGRKNAGKGKVDLAAKVEAAAAEIRRLAPGRLDERFFFGVEEGKLSGRRRKLVEAAEWARKRGAALVAPDLSRFVRSETYCRRTNRGAWPTADEFRLLGELTGGVPLATVEPPALPEDGPGGRHSKATKRGARPPGRPSKYDPVLAARVFEALGYRRSDDAGRPRWERPLADVAPAFGISPALITQWMKKRSPSGWTWEEEGYRKAVARGVMDLIWTTGEDGELVPIPCLADLAGPGNRF